jgi:hypothetical protein
MSPPEKQSTLESAIVIPFAQSAVSGTLTGGLVGAAALVFEWPEPAGLALLTTAGTALIAWLAYRSQWRAAVDFVLGLRPPTMEPQELTTRIQVIAHDPAGAFAAGVWAELPLRPELVTQAARRILATGSISHATLAGPGRPLSRAEYEALRDELIARGLAVWANPDAHNVGLELTAAGRATIRRLANG